MEDIAREIAGVVSAIQAHDITRQQSEHVEKAFAIISAGIPGSRNSKNGDSQDFSPACVGITIQIYQLRSIKATVENWTSQVKRCMGGILQVSTSELVGIGPMVLGQERDVSSQLAHIELMAHESQDYCKRIQSTLEGLSSLMQFVSEHAQRSRSIRDRLRFLSFNSIIEANNLGTKADAVLAIAKIIKEISAEWSQITDRCGHAVEAMEALMKQASKIREVFSDTSNEKLQEAQDQIRVGLENLRTTAAFAATQSRKMELVTAQMQAKRAEVDGTDERLMVCIGQIERILTQLESLKHELESNHPGIRRVGDDAEVERLYSADYTTEMERQVLRAALQGTDLPVAQACLEGNSVELF